MKAFDIQAAIRGARNAGIGSDQIEFMFELTASELEQIESGDLTAWEAKADDAYRGRVAARMKASATGAQRKAERAFGEAEAFRRVHAIMERAGVPDEMTVSEAISSGLLSEEEVAEIERLSDAGL